jgi:hypothetical protein
MLAGHLDSGFRLRSDLFRLVKQIVYVRWVSFYLYSHVTYSRRQLVQQAAYAEFLAREAARALSPFHKACESSLVILPDPPL